MFYRLCSTIKSKLSRTNNNWHNGDKMMNFRRAPNLSRSFSWTMMVVCYMFGTFGGNISILWAKFGPASKVCMGSMQDLYQNVWSWVFGYWFICVKTVTARLSRQKKLWQWCTLQLTRMIFVTVQICKLSHLLGVEGSSMVENALNILHSR